MKILAINGSHRAGKSTAALLEAALEEARSAGAETELVELSQCNIEFCIGCNKCLSSKTCTIDDDMTGLFDKLRAADGIILGSPDYFSNATARMVNFIDRTRSLHMVENQLKGKVGGYVTCAGLSNCGAEATGAVLQSFFNTHEMLVVHPRPEGPVLGSGCTATMFAGYADGKITWQSIHKDEVAFLFARQLGRDMADLIKRLS